MAADTVMTSTAAEPGTIPGSAGAVTERSESAVDAALLARVAAGDPAALGELYDRFARRVYSLARRICGADTGAAQDVTQDVFLDVWRHAARFDPGRGSPASWLLTVAHHKAVDAVRREATVHRRTRAASDEGWELPTGPGADHAAIGSVVAEHVRRALRELPPVQRRVLGLAYYGGYTQTQTAAILGIPVGTVKSRTFNAMAQLREHLGPFEPDHTVGATAGGRRPGPHGAVGPSR